MPILSTAKQHFDEDLRRAHTLRAHAERRRTGLLRDDVMRAAWMMAVGALDAYFCDAYADLIARTLQAKQIQHNVEIPDRLLNLKVPVISVIRSSATENWRWRMAARGLIENESVLSLESIRKLFNHFFRDNEKLFSSSSFDSWILHRDARNRLFGVSATRYRPLTGAPREMARRAAKSHFEDRFEMIFQRRHDCIHNCDRPKIAISSRHIDSATYVAKVLDDVEFVVVRCHEAFLSEFPVYLANRGFSGVTRNRVGA